MRIFAFMKTIGKKIRGFLPLLAVLLLVSPGGRVFGQDVPVPAGGAGGAHKGQTIEVGYTAEYLFYGNK